MAIIIPTLGNIKGKLGGATFQVNPAGNVLRSTPRSRKTSTARQQRAHNNQQGLLSAWQGLTLDQQIEWNEYAALWDKVDKFGVERTLTGANWFLSLNAQLIFAGAAQINTPPAHTLPQEVPEFEIVVSTDSLELEIIGSFDFDIDWLLAFGTPPTSRSSLSVNRINKRLGILSEPVDGIVNITAMWEAATGLEWTPADTFPDTNIVVCLQSVNKVSGITSPFLCVNSPVNNPVTEDDNYFYYA